MKMSYFRCDTNQAGLGNKSFFTQAWIRNPNFGFSASRRAKRKLSHSLSFSSIFHWKTNEGGGESILRGVKGEKRLQNSLFPSSLIFQGYSMQFFRRCGNILLCLAMCGKSISSAPTPPLPFANYGKRCMRACVRARLFVVSDVVNGFSSLSTMSLTMLTG